MTSTKSTKQEGKSISRNLEANTHKYSNNALFSFMAKTLRPGQAETDYPDNAVYATAPGQYISRDEREKLWQLKHDYYNELSDFYGNHKNLKIKYDPKSDIDLLKKREKELELYQFDNFVQTFLDLHDPTQRQMVEELHPGWFERKEDELKRISQLQSTLAHYDLRGIKSKDDLELLYAIAKGRVHVPIEGVHMLKSKNVDMNGQVQLVRPKDFTKETQNPRIELPHLHLPHSDNDDMVAVFNPQSATDIGDHSNNPLNNLNYLHDGPRRGTRNIIDAILQTRNR